VAIVERYPGARVYVTGELASGDLAPERKQEVGEAPVGAVASGGAVGGVLRAPGGVGDMVLRGAVSDGVEDRVVLGDIVGMDMAGVQEAEMRGIDLATMACR
jgi:hypothetical protein